MPLRPEQRYHGTVTRGALIESSKGTPGFEFLIESDEGSITHVIWISSKNEERARKDLAVIGADTSKLANATYLENQLPTDIQGKQIVFGTKEEEYKGKTSIRVAWIGEQKAPASNSLFGSVASIFSGTSTSKPKDPFVTAAGTEVPDDDIPF